MRICIDAGALATTLKQVKAGLSSDDSSTSPYVVIDAQGGNITLSTWRKGLRIAATVPGKVEQEGSYAVSRKQLLRVAGAVQDMIALRREGPGVIISPDGTGGYAFPLQGEDVMTLAAFSGEATPGMTYTKQETKEGYCEACKRPHTEQVSATYQVIGTTVQRATLATSSLDTLVAQVNWLPTKVYHKPSLAAICLGQADQRLSLVGANEFSMAIATTELAGVWEREILVDAKAFSRAVRSLPAGQVQMEATFAQHRLISRNDEPVTDAAPFEQVECLRLLADHVTITLPLMNERYPDYRSVIPTTYLTCLTCAISDLRRTLQALTAVNSRIELRVVGATLRLSVAYQPEAFDEVPLLAQSGEDLNLHVDASYLLAALKPIAASQVTLSLNELGRPLVLRPCGEEAYSFVLQTQKPGA